MKNSICTDKAPGAVGPFSQGVKEGNMIFVSGQLPIDVKTGEFAGNDIASQTRQSLENVKAVLEQAGATMDNVVKTTVLIKDMNGYVDMNTVYSEYFNEPYPARAAFEVARLPKDALVEIEVIAIL